MASSQRAAESKHRGSSSLVVLQVTFAGDDAALVAALREGRPGARAEIFNRYGAQVERIITHVIGLDRELADILQQTFVNALTSLPKLDDPSALKPWLFRIATLTARKVIRTRSRRAWLRFFSDSEEEARHEPILPCPDVDLVFSVREVYATLARFPTDERLAFALRFIEGMELSEVAAACGTSLATVKRRLQRSEQRFVRAAQQSPLLSEWLERGSRWKNA